LGESSLSRLAERLGIEPEYRDTAGRLHRTSPETARRLAAALGVPSGTEMEIVASLEQLEQERWREVLPPVVIGYEQESASVALGAPIGATIRRIEWSIDLEAGGAASGEVWLPSLPVTEVVADFEARRLTLPILPVGYHRLHLSGDLDATCSLIVAPRRCYLPEGFGSHRFWGVAAQLYALRSAANWGIGDFGDLRTLAGWMTASGADTLGFEPLHTLNLDVPESASPYSPSSRLHLNPLYLDVAAIPGFADCEEARAMVDSPVFGAALRAARDSTYVDYTTVASLKLAVLECLHHHFLSRRAAGSETRNEAFRQFVDRSGPHLKSLCVFQALTERFETHIWTSWPEAFRNPASEDVAEFARTHAERVSFFQYLQWLCELQLADAAGGGAAGDMRIGLYRDLAVGVDVCGADCWAEQALFAGEARIGAPPDPFNEAGQEWGLVPFNPRHLRASGYAHFIAMLRSNMRNAGALRIDHIMGWQRLFLIPAGALMSVSLRRT
jgi:4-alpha-glucanotransferase